MKTGVLGEEMRLEESNPGAFVGYEWVPSLLKLTATASRGSDCYSSKDTQNQETAK